MSSVKDDAIVVNSQLRHSVSTLWFFLTFEFLISTFLSIFLAILTFIKSLLPKPPRDLTGDIILVRIPVISLFDFPYSSSLLTLSFLNWIVNYDNNSDKKKEKYMKYIWIKIKEKSKLFLTLNFFFPDCRRFFLIRRVVGEWIFKKRMLRDLRGQRFENDRGNGIQIEATTFDRRAEAEEERCIAAMRVDDIHLRVWFLG